MKIIESINSRGLARGWHAEQLQARALRTGHTMSFQFGLDNADAVAFNVPAEAIKATPQWITYQFIDGSTTRYRNQRHAR